MLPCPSRRSARPFAVFGLVLALASGCGGSATGVRRTTIEPRRPPRVLRADVTAPAIPSVEMRLRDESLLVVRGGRRLMLGQDEVRAAALDFASPVVGLAELDDGFLFLTADGTLHRVSGADPLARPEQVGSTELRRLSMLGASRGRVAVLAGDLVGDLYTSTGGEFTRASLPPRSVVGAVFTDAMNGCVLLFDGTARRTTDGGTTFDVVPGLDRAFALDMHFGQCRFHGGSAEEPTYQTLDERGRGVDYTPDEDDARDGVYPYRPAELYLSRGTMARLGRTRAIALGPGPTTVQVFDLDTGRLLATHEDALPSGCTLADVGEAAAAICTPDEGVPSALYSRDGEDWQPLSGLSRALGLRGAQLYGSDDGQLAWTGPCEDDPAEASQEDTLCVLRDLTTGEHASVMISEHGTSAIRGLAGDYLLAQSASDEAFWLAKLGTEETRTITVPGVRRLVEVELASDATLVVLAEDADGTLAAYVGAPDGELSRRALPEGAIDVSYQSAQLGVAAGRTMREIFRTRDGGLSWNPMRVMLEGDASRTPLLDPERYLECHAQYCLGFSWRAGRGRAFVLHAVDEATPPATLASSGPDRLGEEPHTPLALPTLLRCELGEEAAAPERPALAAGATTTRYGDGTYSAWVDVTTRGRRVSHQVHWTGLDATGAFAASSRVAASNARRGSTLDIDVVSAARSAALLNICLTTDGTRECTFGLVFPGGVPLPLQSQPPHETSHGAMLGAYTPREMFYVVTPTDSGPVIQFFDPNEGSAASFDVGQNIGNAFVGIATSSLGSFFVLTDRRTRFWQAIVEHDEGLAFPPFAAIADQRLSVCSGGDVSSAVRWPGQIRLRFGTGASATSIDGAGYAEVSLSTGPACISGYGLSSDPVFGQLRADAEGRLSGVVESEGTLRNVSCTLR